MISDEELENEIISYRQGRGMDLNLVVLLLQELKERRECELRPARKFVSATREGFEKQFKHVKSEVAEIKEAYKDYMACGGATRRMALLDEITDAQHSLQTLKADLSIARESDMESHRRNFRKNRERGYYDES